VPARMADPIPKNLWIFWEDTSGANSMPQFQAACVASMRRNNPDWQLTILTRESPEIIEWPDAELTVQQSADWARVAALTAYGGVYLDITNIVFQPITTWANLSSDAMQGYLAPTVTNDVEMMESWAFATPANTSLMRQWMASLRTAFEMGTEEYVNTRSPEVAQTTLGGYLAVEVAWSEAHVAAPESPVILMDASVPGGPFAYEDIDGWNEYPSCVAVNRLFKDQYKRPEYTGVRFMKFRGDETNCVCSLPDYVALGSWLATFLLTSLEQPAMAHLNAMVPDASPVNMDPDDKGRDMNCTTDQPGGWPHRPVYDVDGWHSWAIGLGVGFGVLLLIAITAALCRPKRSGDVVSESTPFAQMKSKS